MTHDMTIYNSIRDHGNHSLAYACTQKGLRYFSPSPEEGFIAYRHCWGVDLVLGDPVCKPEALPGMLSAFIAGRRRVAFAQINERTAELLGKLGFRVTPLGVENEIGIKEFDLTGKLKRDLRHSRNRARDAQLTFAEETDDQALRDELQALSQVWLSTRPIYWRQMAFLVRPLANDPESDVRIFTARRGKQLYGFVLFDPIFADGQTTGYTATFLRAVPDAPEGTLDTIVLHAIERFREEGCERLSFGISPLYRLKELAGLYGTGSRLLHWAGRVLYRQGWIYNFRGLSFHKSRYRPHETPCFVAARSRSHWELAALWRACEVI